MRREKKLRVPGDMHCWRGRRWYVTTSTWSAVCCDGSAVELLRRQRGALQPRASDCCPAGWRGDPD